jgi:hypothetical protein
MMWEERLKNNKIKGQRNKKAEEERQTRKTTWLKFEILFM